MSLLNGNRMIGLQAIRKALAFSSGRFYPSDMSRFRFKVSHNYSTSSEAVEQSRSPLGSSPGNLPEIPNPVTVFKPVLQPVFDFEHVIRHLECFNDSIIKRKMGTKNTVMQLEKMYEEAKGYKMTIETQEKEMEGVANNISWHLQDLKAKNHDTSKELKKLQARHKDLRIDIRTATSKFTALNDKIVDVLLSMPNILDPATPEEPKLVRETVAQDGIQKWDFPLYNCHEFLGRHPKGRPSSGSDYYNSYKTYVVETPVGSTLTKEFELLGKAQKFLLENGYKETGCFKKSKTKITSRSVANPCDEFLRIREDKIEDPSALRNYLLGGTNSPFQLADITHTIVKDVPLRCFVAGRSYMSYKTRSGKSSEPGLFHAKQMYVLAGCKTEEEMETEFQKLATMMDTFFVSLGLPKFQVQMVHAQKLLPYEKKRMSFVMNKCDKSPVKLLGDISTLGDYPSKRLLCCYPDKDDKPGFLHLVCGTFFNVTNFLRDKNRLNKTESR